MDSEKQSQIDLIFLKLVYSEGFIFNHMLTLAYFISMEGTVLCVEVPGFKPRARWTAYFFSRYFIIDYDIL